MEQTVRKYRKSARKAAKRWTAANLKNRFDNLRLDTAGERARNAEKRKASA